MKILSDDLRVLCLGPDSDGLNSTPGELCQRVAEDIDVLANSLIGQTVRDLLARTLGKLTSTTRLSAKMTQTPTLSKPTVFLSSFPRHQTSCLDRNEACVLASLVRIGCLAE